MCTLRQPSLWPHPTVCHACVSFQVPRAGSSTAEVDVKGWNSTEGQYVFQYVDADGASATAALTRGTPALSITGVAWEDHGPLPFIGTCCVAGLSGKANSQIPATVPTPAFATPIGSCCCVPWGIAAGCTHACAYPAACAPARRHPPGTTVQGAVYQPGAGATTGAGRRGGAAAGDSGAQCG